MLERDIDHLNGSLHSGISATIVDGVTYCHLLHDETESDKMAVTTDLNISYLGTAKEGDVLTLDTELLKSGKSLCFLKCTVETE